MNKNKVDDLTKQLKKYLSTATKEQLDKDWENIKEWSGVGPELLFVGDDNNGCNLQTIIKNIFVQKKLLIVAVNNLIKENNQLRLIIKNANKEISNKEFEKEIEENGDKYIVSEDYIPSKNELVNALRLSSEINGIGYEEDLNYLFSFKKIY